MLILNENHVLQDDLQILKDAILRSPKNPVIAHLNLNPLMPGDNKKVIHT